MVRSRRFLREDDSADLIQRLRRDFGRSYCILGPGSIFYPAQVLDGDAEKFLVVDGLHAAFSCNILGSGNSSHVRPSSARPVDFFPPRARKDTGLSGLSSSGHIYTPGLSRSRTRKAVSLVTHFQSPHCLKRKGTPAAMHWSRMCRAHIRFIGRAWGPLSPPQMTQCILDRSKRRA